MSENIEIAWCSITPDDALIKFKGKPRIFCEQRHECTSNVVQQLEYIEIEKKYQCYRQHCVLTTS